MKVKLDLDKAHQSYEVDGQKVPGVTTVLGVLAKPALIAWANKEGLAGRDIRKVSGKAASIGTLAHFLCECYVKNNTADLSNFSKDEIKVARNCFEKFVTAWEGERFKLVASEFQAVSHKHLFGGTLDIVALDSKKKPVLIDLKTSSACYKEYFYQLAAYWHLWDESHPKQKITRAVLCRIGKEGDDFEVKEFSNLNPQWNIFLKCRELWGMLNPL